MAIWPEFRTGQYRVVDHREDAPHFIKRHFYQLFWVVRESLPELS